MHQKRIIIIGGITWKETINPRLGGTTVLMDNFIEYCVKSNIPHIVIPTNRYHGHFAQVRNLIYMLFKFFKCCKRGDISMLNLSSDKSLITLFPLMITIGKLCGMQTVCRQFAGSVHTYLDAKSYRKKIAIHFLKKTKVSFFETNEIINWFNKNGYVAEWFPNVRKSSNLQVSVRYEKRLVFLAQVYEDKGVDMLLRISNRLPNDYQIDIYGPIIDPKYNENYFKLFRAKYKGVLKPDEVTKTLSKYNVMVFPTWWIAEGYPGVVIEAMSTCMPIISTYQGGIPEMIIEGENGLLTKVKDEVAFENAILSVNQQSYSKMRKGAEKRFAIYNSELVNPRIVSSILK